MTVYRIVASAPGAFELYELGRPLSVYGPANLLDCCRERQRLVDALIHGERYAPDRTRRGVSPCAYADHTPSPQRRARLTGTSQGRLHEQNAEVAGARLPQQRAILQTYDAREANVTEIAAYARYVTAPPKWAIEHDHWWRWTERGHEVLCELIERIERTERGYVHPGIRKTHAHEVDPFDVVTPYIDADYRCEGGCCDAAPASPWAPQA